VTDATSTQPPQAGTGPSRRTAGAVVLALLATLALTGLDLWSKDWMLEHISRAPAVPHPVCQPDESGHIRMQRIPTRSIELVPGYLEFRYAENCGAAFGMLRTAAPWVRNAVFGVAAIAACLWLGFALWRGHGGRLFAAAVPLIASGALGNLADRIRYGYVVDFIRFHLENRWEYPTFNVADITITVGVVLLVLDGLRKPATAPRQGAEPAGQPGAEA